MSEPPLTDDEIRRLRKIATGISGAEWGALKALATGLVAAMGTGGGNGAAAGGGGAVATDAELRGPYGDKVIKKMPRRWAGDDYTGATMSQCPSELLEMLADNFDYAASKKAAEPEPKKHRNGTFWYVYDRKDAALCRGWARKNKGKTFAPPPPVTTADDGSAGDVGAGDTGDTFDQSQDYSDASEWAP